MLEYLRIYYLAYIQKFYTIILLRNSTFDFCSSSYHPAKILWNQFVLLIKNKKD